MTHGCYSEDDLVPLSALADFLYCTRRAALHFVEQQWEDNRFTAEGTLMHRRAHEPATESRGDIRIARGLLVNSMTLGLSGKLDVVEFHRAREAASPASRAREGQCDATAPPPSRPLADAVALPDVDGLWRPFPVEYKRGRLRREEGYEVQACAQALCIEEMLAVSVPRGALYYGATGRRLDIDFDDALRQATRQAAMDLHALVGDGLTPPASYGKKCDKCSLLNICMPNAGGRSARRYVNDTIAMAEGECE